MNASREDNYSWVLKSIDNLQLEKRPRPHPKPNEVVIAIKATGICGSDVHYWVDGRIGDFVVERELILGHESAGIIDEIGENVKNLKVGDAVVIEPGAPCYVCSYCRKGSYNLCPDMKFPATPPINGTLCKYYCCSEDLCIKLPENFPPGIEGGALIEPLSVGIHACNQAGLRAGQSVIIFGAGPVGLLAAAVAKASGAIKVTVVDINQSRLDFAKGYVADDVILAEVVTAGDNVIDHCKRFAKSLVEAGKERSDVVLECSGAEPSIITGIYMTRPGGTYVQVGMGNDVVALPITHIGIREITIRGCFRYSNAHRQAVQMVAAGLIDLKPLVTHKYKFQEAIQAFQTVRDQKDGVIKALILGD